MFERLQDIQLRSNDTVATAMECISRNIKATGGYGVALVVDGDGRLVGVVTDGDIRRALLRNHTLDSPLEAVMSRNPVSTTADRRGYHQLLRLFERGIRQVPVLDTAGRPMDLILYEDLAPGSGIAGTVIRAKAPLRVSFAGGGTDMTHVFEKTRGAVISATIDRYCYAEVVPRDDPQIILCSRDYDQKVSLASSSAIQYDGNLDLLKAAVSISKPDFGFELYTSCDVPPGSGLGASSALAVAIIGLIGYVRTGRVDEYRIADLAFQAERVELKVRGGWQDQYAAAFGGLNYIEFDSDGVVVHSLRLQDRVRYELESNLVLGFTGETRNSGEVHAGNAGASSGQAADYWAMLDLVAEMRRALLTGNLTQFGHLLDRAWQAKKQLNHGASSRSIDHIYELAMDHGALGGKLLGAGKGGYLLFYCDPARKHQVQEAMRKAGVTAVTFNFDPTGLRIWPSQRLSQGGLGHSK